MDFQKELDKKYVAKEQYRLQKPWHPGETGMKWKSLRPEKATERTGSLEISSPVGRDLGRRGDRNTAPQTTGVQLLCFLSRAVLLITCATNDIRSL